MRACVCVCDSGNECVHVGVGVFGACPGHNEACRHTATLVHLLIGLSPLTVSNRPAS